MNPQKIETTGHVYDGIQEYDNPLPSWWTWLFVLTIVYSGFYLIYYHLGTPGRSIHDDYEREMERITIVRFGNMPVMEPNRETILAAITKPEYLSVGKAFYNLHCTSCHGSDGQGLIGPNLTDEFWKHVVNIEDIARIINEGAANGNMPAFGNKIRHPNQLVLAAAYVASLRGTNPPGGKAPEGNQIPPWQTP